MIAEKNETRRNEVAAFPSPFLAVSTQQRLKKDPLIPLLSRIPFIDMKLILSVSPRAVIPMLSDRMIGLDPTSYIVWAVLCVSYCLNSSLYTLNLSSTLGSYFIRSRFYRTSFQSIMHCQSHTVRNRSRAHPYKNILSRSSIGQEVHSYSFRIVILSGGKWGWESLHDDDRTHSFACPNTRSQPLRRCKTWSTRPFQRCWVARADQPKEPNHCDPRIRNLC